MTHEGDTPDPLHPCLEHPTLPLHVKVLDAAKGQGHHNRRYGPPASGTVTGLRLKSETGETRRTDLRVTREEDRKNSGGDTLLHNLL